MLKKGGVRNGVLPCDFYSLIVKQIQWGKFMWWTANRAGLSTKTKPLCQTVVLNDIEIINLVEIRIPKKFLRNLGVKPVIQPIRAKNISSPF